MVHLQRERNRHGILILFIALTIILGCDRKENTRHISSDVYENWLLGTVVQQFNADFTIEYQ